VVGFMARLLNPNRKSPQYLPNRKFWEGLGASPDILEKREFTCTAANELEFFGCPASNLFTATTAT
jgi:hypothetical protein